MLAEAGDVARSPARRLIVAYAAATALLNLSVVLPDNPYSFSTTKGAIAAVVIQALIVWGLWRGSVVAWVVATALAVLGFFDDPVDGAAGPHQRPLDVGLVVRPGSDPLHVWGENLC